MRNASLQRSVSQLERDVEILRFSVQTLALRTPHCGPGQSASEKARESYIHCQEQLDALIIEYEQAREELWKVKKEEQGKAVKQQRRMTIS